MTDTSGAPTPKLSTRPRPHTRRWAEQRWLVDNVIEANGIDWDQPRSNYLNVPCGIEASPDFAAIRQQVKKFADCSFAFEQMARKREAKARAAEADGNLVTARTNYFIAAIHWGAAQWPIETNDETNLSYNASKRACYSAYARLADHHVEAAWIPFGDTSLPAWLHLPPGYSGGRLPVIIAIPGMDSFKEGIVQLNGDPLLQRGFAVLALDGPGQYESAVLDIPVSMENWRAAGPAVCDWLAERPEIDAERIALTGRSFGAFFGTILTANEPRIRACAVSAACHEPGFHTIFEEASPTFKMRYMYMAGYDDEAAFDEFRMTLTWEDDARKVAVPWLCIAGEADELASVDHTERMMAAMQGPKQILIYQNSRHSVRGPAAQNGPHPQTYISDWLVARLDGKPMQSERWLIETSGKVVKTPL